MDRFRISGVMLLVIRSRRWFEGKTENGFRRRETPLNRVGAETSADLAWAGRRMLDSEAARPNGVCVKAPHGGWWIARATENPSAGDAATAGHQDRQTGPRAGLRDGPCTPVEDRGVPGSVAAGGGNVAVGSDINRAAVPVAISGGSGGDGKGRRAEGC